MQGRLDIYMQCLVVVELAAKLCKTKRHYYKRQTPFFQKHHWTVQNPLGGGSRED
jgi:hypothetical protein